MRGLSCVPVQSEEEALSAFYRGDQCRCVSPHLLNKNSSRSHCLLTLHIEMRTSMEANDRAVLSKIHLVDLAGSERTKKTNASGAYGFPYKFTPDRCSGTSQVSLLVMRGPRYGRSDIVTCSQGVSALQN